MPAAVFDHDFYLLHLHIPFHIRRGSAMMMLLAVANSLLLTSVLCSMAPKGKAQGKAKGKAGKTKAPGPPPEKTQPAKAKAEGDPPGAPAAKKSAPPTPAPLVKLDNKQNTYIRNHFMYWGSNKQDTEYGKECKAALATFDELCGQKRKEFYEQWMEEKGNGKDAKALKGLVKNFSTVAETEQKSSAKGRQKWVTVTQLMQEFGLSLKDFPTLEAGCTWASNKWMKNAKRFCTQESHPPKIDDDEALDTEYFYLFDDGTAHEKSSSSTESWKAEKDMTRGAKNALEDTRLAAALVDTPGVKIENQNYVDMSTAKDELRRSWAILSSHHYALDSIMFASLSFSAPCNTHVIPHPPPPFLALVVHPCTSRAGRSLSPCAGSTRR